MPGSINVSNGTTKSKIFLQLSDAQLKTNISDISNALLMVSSMKGYTYKWKKNSMESKSVVGFIAQEIAEVLPEVISSSEKSIKNKIIKSKKVKIK